MLVGLVLLFGLFNAAQSPQVEDEPTVGAVKTIEQDLAESKQAAPPDPVDTEPEPEPEPVQDVRSISDPDAVTEEAKPTQKPEQDTEAFAETFRKELEKETLSEPEVVYNEYDKIIVVKLNKAQSFGPESFRRDMFLDTMSTMAVAVNHKDMINEVKITGWTNMIGTDGNSELMKVYKADRSMSGADSINWENLKGYPDMLQAIENNFDSVYWHPGVL